MELLDCMVALFSNFFLEYLYNILHSDCTNFPSHQQYMRISLSLQPYQHLISVVLLKTVLLISEVKSQCGFDVYFPDSDAEHLFRGLLAICVSLEECLFRPSAHF